MFVHRVKFGLIFILLVSIPVYGDAFYSWRDEAGTIHISETKPPQNARQAQRWIYSPPPLATKTPTVVLPEEKLLDTSWLQKVEQATLERKKANEAKHMAEAAIEAANRLKTETEAFLEPWRNKSRIKRHIQSQIEQKIQDANTAIERAETLIKRSEEAEEAAQKAELEAKRAEKELFERYRRIASN